MFKKCSCNKIWDTMHSFLSDKDIKIVGYQADLDIIEEGFYLFNNTQCQTSLAVNVKLLLDLYSGQIYPISNAGKETCRGYCLASDNLEPCGQECSNAHVRKLIKSLQDWPKI